MMLKTCHTVHANISVANYVVIVDFCNSALSFRENLQFYRKFCFLFFFLEAFSKIFCSFQVAGMLKETCN